MRFCCTVLSLLLVATSLPAAEDPLDALPAKSGVVLRLSPPSEIAGKAKSFLNKAAPRYAPIADSLGIGLGSLIGNPTLRDVDANRDWYVAVIPRPEQRPAMLFAVPTNNAAGLKQAVGPGYAFVEHDDWVLYSLDAATVEALSLEGAAAEDSIRAQIVEPLLGVFTEGEAGIYLNIPVLREAYQPQIEQAREQLIRASEPASDDVAPVEGAEAKAENANRKLLETLLATIDDMTGVAKSVTIGEAALEVEAVVAVESDSKTAGFLAKQKPVDFPLLAKLPQGRLAYYALAGDFSDFVTASISASAAMSPENDELRQQFEELGKLRFEEAAGSIALGPIDGGVYRGVSLIRVDKPDQYLELARRMTKSLNAARRPEIQQEISIEPQAETISGVKVDVLKIQARPSPEQDPNGSIQKFLDVLFGKEGVTQRLAVVEGLFVQAVGDEASVMESAVAAARGQTPADEPAQKAADATRARIGESANLLALVDLPRLLGGAVQIAIDSGELPLPVDQTAIDSLNLAPSYTGLTVVAGQNEVRVRGVMPAEQVQGIVRLFDVLQKAAPKRRPAN